MTFIEPLNMEQWFINVLSGSPDIFLGIAIMVIASMSAYFRMNAMAMLLMITIFLLIMSPFINSVLVILIFVFVGLGIGFTISKIIQ
jgi:hypothetical protein